MNPKFEMPKTTYTPTGQRWKTKWGFCEVYEGWRQKKKISEVCFADGDRVVPGLREADLGIKRYAAEFNGGQAGAAARKRLDEEIKPGGKKTFSLKTIVYHHGTPVRVTEVTEARQESLAPALFELPTNLKKR
jgi:hypothetical protein